MFPTQKIAGGYLFFKMLILLVLRMHRIAPKFVFKSEILIFEMANLYYSSLDEAGPSVPAQY